MTLGIMLRETASKQVENEKAALEQKAGEFINATLKPALLSVAERGEYDTQLSLPSNMVAVVDTVLSLLKQGDVNARLTGNGFTGYKLLVPWH